MFVFLFLAIFKPFGITLLGDDVAVYAFGFGSVTTLCLLLSLFLLPIVFKTFFKSDKWTIGKNVLFAIWNILFIGSFNWYYNLLIVKNYDSSVDDYGSFIVYTVSIGVFPSILFFITDEKITRDKREKIAQTITKQKNKLLKQ